MPSHLHENLVELFRERPGFAAELLTGQLGIPVPTFEQAQVSSGELNDVMPTGKTLNHAARDYLEAFMTTAPYRYASEFARRYYDEGEVNGKVNGKAEGKAEDVLSILAARDIEPTDEIRERISHCADLDQLDIWIRRAATATTADELFS